MVSDATSLALLQWKPDSQHGNAWRPGPPHSAYEAAQVAATHFMTPPVSGLHSPWQQLSVCLPGPPHSPERVTHCAVLALSASTDESNLAIGMHLVTAEFGILLQLKPDSQHGNVWRPGPPHSAYEAAQVAATHFMTPPICGLHSPWQQLSVCLPGPPHSPDRVTHCAVLALSASTDESNSVIGMHLVTAEFGILLQLKPDSQHASVWRPGPP